MVALNMHFREIPKVSTWVHSVTLSDENGTELNLFASGMTRTEMVRHLRDEFNRILGESDQTNLVNAVACGLVE